MAKTLPKCTIQYDPRNGDYDCDAVHGQGCEYCLCNWHNTGGTICPDTEKQYTDEEATALFGEPEYIKDLPEIKDDECSYLLDADPNCQHEIESKWSGVKCKKCEGWFGY